MFVNSGKTLLSLNLKGCLSLTGNTIKNISLYCSILKHFSMWDAADVNIITEVANLNV